VRTAQACGARGAPYYDVFYYGG